MFPSIFALGTRGLGARTKSGAACIVMAIIGGALITLAMGRVADRVNIADAYLCRAALWDRTLRVVWIAMDPEEIAAESAWRVRSQP